MAGTEALILHHRRVLTMQSQVQDQTEQHELAGTMRAVRDKIPATPLPDAFPHRALLIGAGYSAVEDLQDVTEEELMGGGIGRRREKEVIAALMRAT